MSRLWVFVICIAVLGQGVCATNTQLYSIEPSTNDGKKWRLGYIEGGPYQTYPITLLAVVRALVNLGWLEEMPPISIREGEDKTAETWNRLASLVKSDYIEFVADAYWSANWDKIRRAENSETVIQRLNGERDIDLMIAMGTRAAEDIANDEHTTNTLVFAATDPVSAKIVINAQNSGHKHVHVRVDPKRFRRQVDLFHTLIPFKKLGIVYIDDETGRSYAALKDVEASAAARGFELERCHINPDAITADAIIETIACHKELAPKVDAFYITIQSGVSSSSLPQLLAPLNEKKVPTFSQAGALEVEQGVLISMAQGGSKNVARFHAENIAKVLNGALPGDLNQIFEDPPKIALNLDTARAIGYDPSVDILVAIDEFYQETRVVE